MAERAMERYQKLDAARHGTLPTIPETPFLPMEGVTWRSMPVLWTNDPRKCIQIMVLIISANYWRYR